MAGFLTMVNSSQRVLVLSLSLLWENMFVLMLVTVVITAPALAAEEEGHHRHHVAVAGGLARNDSKTSGFLGVDYFYRFGEQWAAGIFLEEVSGDFDIRA